VTGEAFAKYLRDAAAAAAKWWADRLRDAAGVGDNGSRDPSSLMAGGFIALIRAKSPPTEDNCVRFERELTHAIATLIERHDQSCWPDLSGFDDGGPCVRLRVDYHPCPVLYGALLEAGVHESVADTAALPLKTNMRVSARRVLLAHGYGSPWHELWGPAWGSSFAEQQAADLYRSRAGEAEHEAWMAERDARWQPRDWKGCVPQ